MRTTGTSSVLIAVLLGLCGCGSSLLRPSEVPVDPDRVRARIATLLPGTLANRGDWAADLFAALEALGVEASDRNVCAVLAVTEQESGYQVNPAVPNLPAIARREIDAKAAALKIPRFAVGAALEIRSPDGRSYRERIEAARTEKALNDIFEDFLDQVPLGRRLFAGYNPVRTAGPMQVSIAYAEEHARRRRYPFPMQGSLRDELFTRRGGLYFGAAHLLDYPADYEDMLHRFADFNAGHWASRNAAFQNALAMAAGRKVAMDGDLLIRGDGADRPSQTELAARSLAGQLGLSEREIRRDLERGTHDDFARTRLYRGVFEIATRRRGRSPPAAVMPRIRLQSPKITRNLTTEWFAQRVDGRYQRCLARAAPVT
ncbi:MAG: DUF1615 domain-containing protein [Steroidobacteraceae bacterium]|jgi:hypothetical protein|nr:DUF1615 domain-containing protein [Steroidobacteraceae bacterium]